MSEYVYVPSFTPTRPDHPVRVQRQVVTVCEGLDHDGRVVEAAECPFCQTVNRGSWFETSPGELLGIDPTKTCEHFRGFVSGGPRIVVIHFNGWSDALVKRP